MRPVVALLFATKYWPSPEELRLAVSEMESRMSPLPVVPVIDGKWEGEETQGGDLLIAVPMSGAVQPQLLALAARFSQVVLYAGYVAGNVSGALSDRMLTANAAPTLMDTYATLRRERPDRVSLCITHEDLESLLTLSEAVGRVRGAKLLLIGAVEPWVVSPSRDLSLYQRQLGITVEQVPLEALLSLYEQTEDGDAERLYTYFSDAVPTEDTPPLAELRAACRMGAALLTLLERHGASGAALACFDLIAKTATSACLAASYINGETPYFMACEGDLDSAVTMLLLRAVTDAAPFMANPSLGRDGTVSFSHCTAPLCAVGGRSAYTLLCHHETGKSISPAVSLPEGAEVTLVRYGSVQNRLTLSLGTTVTNRVEPTCRTRVTVRPQDLAHYLDTVLGCHQVLVFAPVADRVAMLARMLGVEVC